MISKKYYNILLFVLLFCLFDSQTIYAHNNLTSSSSTLKQQLDYMFPASVVEQFTNMSNKIRKHDLAIQSLYRLPKSDIREILLWQYLASNSNLNFTDYTQFILQHKKWPNIDILQENAEKSLNSRDSFQSMQRFFEIYAPKTSKAQHIFAKAKLKHHHTEDNKLHNFHTTIKNIWHKVDALDEKDFLQNYHNILTDQDHSNRLNYLLCNSSYQLHNISKDWLQKLDSKQKKLLDQYISIFHNPPKRPINNIHPCLAYHHIKKANDIHDDDVVQNLLINYQDIDFGNKEFCKIKMLQARNLMKKGEFRQAALIAASHGLTSGEEFADSEFLAGWLHLTKLNDPHTASGYFKNLYDNLSTSVSLAKAAYWLGYSYEKLGDKQKALHWYQKASIYHDCFYGQCALEKVSDSNIKIIEPIITQADIDILLHSNLVKAAYLFLRAGDKSNAIAFLKASLKQVESPGAKRAIAELPVAMGHKSVGIRIAKELAKNGIVLIQASYPHIKLTRDKLLIHSIIRQESEFDANAKSHAGAIGLTQLLPETAKLTARSMNIGFHQHKLYDAEYNMKIGTTYFNNLLDKYHGCAVLALAAYNAGPGNADRWIDLFGDPREMKKPQQVIDWVESITFSETRTYIQRIMSNLQVYKYILYKNGYNSSVSSDILCITR